LEEDEGLVLLALAILEGMDNWEKLNRIGHTAQVVSDVTSPNNSEMNPERCQIVLEKLEMNGLIILASDDSERLWALEPQVKQAIQARRKEQRRWRTLREELQDIDQIRF
jgi:hypothetical protein